MVDLPSAPHLPVESPAPHLLVKLVASGRSMSRNYRVFFLCPVEADDEYDLIAAAEQATASLASGKLQIEGTLSFKREQQSPDGSLQVETKISISCCWSDPRSANAHGRGGAKRQRSTSEIRLPL